MKILAIIFSVFLISLAVMPKAEIFISQKKSCCEKSKDSKDTSQTKKSCCNPNPFSGCCCNSGFILNEPLEVIYPIEKLSGENTFYQTFSLPKLTYAIWQPPKIAA
jgi:hypothetical protein